jgi:hypothetical protein
VRFIVDGQEVATAVTDERGFVKAIVTLDKPAERFEASANFAGEEHRSEAEVVAWRNDRVIVACDIDAASYGVYGMLVPARATFEIRSECRPWRGGKRR